MIRGIGTDIVQNCRIKELLAKAYAPRFLARVLSPAELREFQQRSPERQVTFLAGRWAAKESLVKAYGLRDLQFAQITIAQVPEQAPTVDLGPNNAALVRARHPPSPQPLGPPLVTISHEAEYTVAFALVQCAP